MDNEDRSRDRIRHALDRMESAVGAARIALEQNAPFSECGDMLVSIALETMKYMAIDDTIRRVAFARSVQKREQNGGAK